jgi:hypothetical protein
MKEFDQLETSFITPFGMYCYVTLPFGLRNAGATYQRCMQHVFGEHIRPTVEAYVDDIVVKIKKASNLISDLDVAFKCLRAKNIKLNPEKCVFGVPRGMLLGFIMQRVTGCLAALSRFISCLGKKALPLYRLLKKSKHFSWTLEAEEALARLKAMLSNSPILVPPTLGEPLLLYVTAMTQVVSVVLVVKRAEEGHTLLI